jgi:hypothetical protein
LKCRAAWAAATGNSPHFADILAASQQSPNQGKPAVEAQLFRRRRRSSVRSAGRGSGQKRLILIGFLAIALVAALTYFVHVADTMKPDRHEIRVELPHALAP